MSDREQLTDQELAPLIDFMVSNSVTDSGSFNGDQEKYLRYYKGEPFGDETPGKSSVVSTDVRDLVESDMPSLARVFLGAGAPVEFKAVSTSPDAIKEARDKQAVVSTIIAEIPNSFRMQHDWLKASEIQSVSALEYGCEEIEETKTKRYHDINADERTAIVAAIEADKDVKKVDIIEADNDDEDTDGTFDVTFRITYEKKQWFLRGVPIEDFIVSRNAVTKQDADVIGKRFKKTRGALLQDGFSRQLIESLPTSGNQENENTNALKQVRYEEQGGEEADNAAYLQWANQEVEGVDVYALVDYDGDGIAERRHIIKVGNVILENEAFDHIPYAINSSMLMPYDLMGMPRAELAMTYQRTQSVIWRNILDNIYTVNNPRIGYQGSVDVDDLLDNQLNGVIDMGENGVLQPIVMPYIGDKALQVVAFMDGKKSASTGTQVGNQALQADNLHKETATRTESIEAAGTAKIELVARVIAETGYKDLWEGIAWFANHYQDSELEVRVLGREMTVNPSEWKHDHRICAKVGTGAGDTEKTLANLTAIFQTQTQLLQEGSVLTDETKRYNTLAEIIQTTGRNDVTQYFNDPEQPLETVTAERDIQKKMIEQLEAGMQNPLAEAEAVRAKGELEKTQLSQKFNAQIEQMKMQANFDEKLRDAQIGFKESTDKLTFDYNELKTNTDLKYTELELKYNTDIVGEGQGE